MILIIIYFFILLIIFTNSKRIENMSNDDKLLTYRIVNGNYDFFDLTNFLNVHPGGSNNLLKVKNKNFEQEWINEGKAWHLTNSHVEYHLNQYKLPDGLYRFNSSTNKIELA